MVGLGNPGAGYRQTRHNVGFRVAEALAEHWELKRSRDRYRAHVHAGRAGPGGPQVAVLLPQTYMNEAGRSVGPARGAYRVPLEHVLVIHDEIDLPFGDVRPRLGGGLAGHNGLKSVRAALGAPNFARVRVGVGRPETTDPEQVSAWVLGPFAEPVDAVERLVADAAKVTEDVIAGRHEL